MKERILLAGMLCLMLAFGAAITGCASVQARAGKIPIQVISSVNTNSSKVSKLSSSVYLGVFGDTNYPSIADTATAGGITKIATVEYYKRPGVFKIWTEYTTIVTGE